MISEFVKMLGIAIVSIILVALLPEYQYDSLEDLKTLPVGHQLFGGEVHTLAHSVAEFFPGLNTTQGERIDSIRTTLFEALAVFKAVGLPVFVESATLIGYLRGGDIVPWDNDADIGYYIGDCLRSFPEAGQLKEAVRGMLGSRFEVMGLDACEHHERVHGQVVDKTSGFYVDLFAYTDFTEALLPWQAKLSSSWIKRVNDEEYANLTFPRDVLFPLKTALWFGNEISVPANSVKLLNYEYGSVLAEPLIPWKLMYYTHCSASSLVLAAAAALLSWDVHFITGTCLAIISIKGGLKVMLLLIASVLGSTSRSRFRQAVSTMAVASLIYDLLPWLIQLKDVIIDATNLSGDNVNPSRTQTVCFPGTRACLDF